MNLPKLSVSSNVQSSLVGASLTVVVALSFTLGVFHSWFAVDTHHWGLQYSTANDILHGQAPYTETLSPYGLLTDYLHALALLVFGDSHVSLGIITSLFYSLSFPIFYFVVRGFLPRLLSLIAVLVLFSLHSHIKLPWPNYIAFPFLLISLALLKEPLHTMNSSARSAPLFFSGIFLSLSLLSRNTFFISVFPSFFLVFLLSLHVTCESRRRRLIGYFLGGFFVPLAVFFLYLLSRGIVSDWYHQTFVLYSEFWYKLHGISKLRSHEKLAILAFYRLRDLAHGTMSADVRLRIYSATFFVCASTSAYFVYVSLTTRDLKWSYLSLISLLATFGFLQSPHVMLVWRLQTICGIGIGIVIYLLYKIGGTERNTLLLVISALLIAIYLPGQKRALRWVQKADARTFSYKYVLQNFRNWGDGRLREPAGIAALTGKLLPLGRARALEEIERSISSYRCRTTNVINMTSDATLAELSPGQKRSQVAPFYEEKTMSAKFFSSETARIHNAIKARKSILLIEESTPLPSGYHLVNEVPGQGGVLVRIAIPDDPSWRQCVPSS